MYKVNFYRYRLSIEYIAEGRYQGTGLIQGAVSGTGLIQGAVSGTGLIQGAVVQTTLTLEVLRPSIAGSVTMGAARDARSRTPSGP